ncbi:hypothetical protein Tco_0784923, partial [Tanacetum coccineum]
ISSEDTSMLHDLLQMPKFPPTEERRRPEMEGDGGDGGWLGGVMMDERWWCGQAATVWTSGDTVAVDSNRRCIWG